MAIPDNIGKWLQFSLCSLAEDDDTCAGFVSGIIDGIPNYTEARWKLGADMISGLVLTGLVRFWNYQYEFPDDTSMLKALRTLNPFTSDGGIVWNGTFITPTDRLTQLVHTYFPPGQPVRRELDRQFIDAVDAIIPRDANSESGSK